MRTLPSRSPKFRKVTILAAAAALVATGGAGAALAKGGGTAKPPKGIVSPWVVPTLATPGSAAQARGFDDTGFASKATVNPDNTSCPTVTDPAYYGGTVTINGILITIPCNLVVQMPANTLTWADFVHGTGGTAPLGVDGLELRAVGNIVGSRHIAGLAFVSQQSANSGRGEITGIDYANGALKVANAAGGTVTVQLERPQNSRPERQHGGGDRPVQQRPVARTTASAWTKTTPPSTPPRLPHVHPADGSRRQG